MNPRTPRRRVFGLPWPAALLAVQAGVLFGSGLYTFHYARGTSYLRDDPAACANCHVMRDHLIGWERSSHHAVATCNDCHIPAGLATKWLVKAENGFWHSFRFTTRSYPEPIRIRFYNLAILNANCVRCHADLALAADRDCVRCHRDVGHGPTR